MSKTITALNDVQAWMQNALIYPGQVTQTQISENLADTGQLSAIAALGIYQRSYYARLLSCMRDQFPALCFSLGEAIFNQFATEYLREHPSNSYTLYELGSRFPNYLNDTRPDRDKDIDQRERWIDFMVELAEFERLAFGLFDAKGDEPRLVTQLDAADHDLLPQRCLAIHQARFPVAHFYCAVRDNGSPTLPPYKHSFVALVRKEFKTQLIPLSYEQYTLLYNFIQTSSLSSALERSAQSLAKVKPMNSNELSAYLLNQWAGPTGWKTSWIKQGLFKARE